MDFMTAIKTFYARYTDFSGRSRRSEFWWFFLYFMVASVLIVFVAGLLGETVGSIVYGLWLLAHLVGLIALYVRRFHDQDKSGWFFLLGFIPIVGGIILLVFMVLPGTDGPNRFGPDPKAGLVADTFT